MKIFDDQQRLRENMKALKGSADEKVYCSAIQSSSMTRKIVWRRSRSRAKKSSLSRRTLKPRSTR